MFNRPVISSVVSLSLAAMVSLTMPVVAQEPSDPALLQAKIWDQPIVIGSGAYRGTTVVAKPKIEHTIRPRALVEKVDFRGEGNPRWKIEGALLREVKFSGDLGTQLDAKDTGFEECHFAKSGGWFVGWAGTKWRFENCVFTRSFMPASFGVHDYSVRAVDCTFVGIKMPVFGLKKNPAQGVQGKDLQFVKCRFVSCEISETTLALTVDCAFENCQFIPKKHDWEKAEGPVTVNAYVPIGKTPPSYVNGKLTVTFTQGQPPQPVGAKLEHTIAGPRIIMPWAQQVQAYTVIGSQEKAVSQIPVFAKGATKPAAAVATSPAQPPFAVATPPPVANLPTPPGAPANRTTIGRNSFFNLPDPESSRPPTAAPAPPPVAATSSTVAVAPTVSAPQPPANAPREVRGLDELFVVVPLEQEFVTQGRVNPAALDAVNLKLDQAWAGKPAAFRVTVDELVAHREDGYAFKAVGQVIPLSLRGQAISGRIEALFRPDVSARLARVQKNSVILVKGVLSKVELTGTGRTVKLTVAVADAALQ